MSSASANLIFRPFAPSDQPRVSRLVLEGLGDHFPKVDPTLDPDLNDIAASYIAKGHSFVVAEIESQIVAAGALIDQGDGRGRLARVSVAEEHRRQGIGQAMVNYLLTLAREKGYRQMLVETNHDWTAAITLYQRCGFQPYDRDDVSVHMQLDLSASYKAPGYCARPRPI